MSNEFFPFAFGHNCITTFTKHSGNVRGEFLLQAKTINALQGHIKRHHNHL